MKADVRNTLEIHEDGVSGGSHSISMSSAHRDFALFTLSSPDGLKVSHTAFSQKVIGRVFIAGAVGVDSVIKIMLWSPKLVIKTSEEVIIRIGSQLLAFHDRFFDSHT